ncbi:MAG: hypothetical protein ACE361_12790 [Aureliella sp.]
MLSILRVGHAYDAHAQGDDYSQDKARYDRALEDYVRLQFEEDPN